MTHLARRSRPALRGTALVAAAVTIAGASAAAALAAPAGHRAPRTAAASTVPWRQVGPGWSVAEYSAASAPEITPQVKGATTLYAVSPQGRKYAFYRWPATADPKFNLVDWSGDKKRVLLQEFGTNVLEQISVVTGKVVNTFRLPRNAAAIGYTRPDGLNVLAARTVGRLSEIVRYDLTGHLQKVLVSGTTLTSAIEAPDGKTVIVGNVSGLEQVSNLGGVTKRMRPPVAEDGCNPVRWWNSRTVLGQCFGKAKGGGSQPSRLWLFPVGRGKVAALTGQRTGKGEDQGDIDAWKLTDGLYLQSLGACGVQFINQQYRNGSVHVVVIPGAPGNDHVVTGQGASLLVQTLTECPGSSSLLWFNPGTKAVKYVLHAPNHVYGVFAVVPYGRPLA